MRVCVVLSGSVRYPEKSASAIEAWRGVHDVDVHLHCWRNVGTIHPNHWNKVVDQEPTSEVLDRYRAKSVLVEDWESVKATKLRPLADRLELPLGSTIESLNPLGMYYSVARAYESVADPLSYDVLVRMRFDLAVHDDPFLHRHGGWVIPEGGDFSGVNDRFGWVWMGGDSSEKWASAYFRLYDEVERLIAAGCRYSPEELLAASLRESGSPVTRVPFNYSILGFS